MSTVSKTNRSSYFSPFHGVIIWTWSILFGLAFGKTVIVATIIFAISAYIIVATFKYSTGIHTITLKEAESIAISISDDPIVKNTFNKAFFTNCKIIENEHK